MTVYIITAISIVVGVFAQYMFIFGPKRDNHKRMLVFKTMASMCFAIIGITAACQIRGDIVSRLIVIGLVLGLLGDVFLQLRLILKGKLALLCGILTFLAGHGMYIAAMCLTTGKWYVALIYTIIIFPPLRKYITSQGMDFGRLLYLGMFYMAAEVFMSGMAMSWMVSSVSLQSVLFFIGSVAFVFSDTLWIFDNFSIEKKPIYRTLCLVPYYIAQNLFAISLII